MVQIDHLAQNIIQFYCKSVLETMENDIAISINLSFLTSKPQTNNLLFLNPLWTLWFPTGSWWDLYVIMESWSPCSCQHYTT